MCWEKSKIPLEIWKAGNASTNLAEGLQADVNREGIHCLLVGGIHHGYHFDIMRFKAQQVRCPRFSGYPWIDSTAIAGPSKPWNHI